MKKRGKGLSTEDKEVWRHVTSSVKRSLPEPKKPSEEIAKPAPPTPPKPAGFRIKPFAVGQKASTKKITQPPAFTPRPARTSANMDKRNFQRLIKGQIDIDGVLDLHGLTADQAKARLQTYLVQSHAMGFRMILVITGKGRTKGVDEFNRPKAGVLRESLRDWLMGPLLSAKVLQVSQAQPKHGGAGAYYVYLRRIRE
ncbi:DNA mismatch repair protein MutS [Amylibacter marinus]|uniref:DNA mismatch repair protein MutS n=1 Tax=Amylibacter marinus TaxID=1475483 RepID=A0ABQ5VWH8_9RHOB|nr:Smr/MutS family protein [Amylibacter marinus]GLQ35537.1 DNA mismatch repair protein MutS [Amylibacter marinus]